MRHAIHIGLASLGLVLFALGCEEAPLQDQADQVRNAAQREADMAREASQREAEGLRDQANKQSEQAESKADRIEEQGEKVADTIEAHGEQIADTIEAADAYWREHYKSRPYVLPDTPYETYREAYLFGWEARKRHAGLTFDDAVKELEREWNELRTDAMLTWQDAKEAVRDAWNARK
jgi:hypothetical protein